MDTAFTLLVIMGAQYSLMLVLIEIMGFILTKKTEDFYSLSIL